MLVNLLIIGFFLVILYTLFSSFWFMVKDKGQGKRVVNRLSWRIGLSIVFFLGLWLAFKLGWLEPQGHSPVNYGSQQEQSG